MQLPNTGAKEGETWDMDAREMRGWLALRRVLRASS